MYSGLYFYCNQRNPLFIHRLHLRLFRCLMIKKNNSFTGHTGSVYALSKVDNSVFLSCSGDGIIAQWDLTKPNDGNMLVNVNNIAYAMHLLKSKNHLLTGSATGSLHVLDVDSKKEIRLLNYHKQGVFKIAYSEVHSTIVIAGGDGNISFIDAKSYALIKTIHLGNFKIRSLCFSNDDENLFVGCGDGSVCIIEMGEQKAIHKISAHAEGFSVNAICFSEGENYLFTASRDARINVFDVKNNFKLLESIPAHNYAIYEMQFSPSKKYMATASRDKTVKVWDAQSTKVLARIDKEKYNGHVNSVNTLLWMSDDVLLTAGDDRSIILWQLETDKLKK